MEFEISIENVDKPPLDYTEMQLRAEQFRAAMLPLWLRGAPTFDEKSRLFPAQHLLVGVDTLERTGSASIIRRRCDGGGGVYKLPTRVPVFGVRTCVRKEISRR